jgi:hypothetical protein
MPYKLLQPFDFAAFPQGLHLAARRQGGMGQMDVSERVLAGYPPNMLIIGTSS